MCGTITTYLLYPPFLEPQLQRFPEDQALQTVSKIISLGVNLDHTLQQALRRRSWHHVAWLIERGAKPDIGALGATLENSRFHELPLFHICQLLTHHGVDVDASIGPYGENWVGNPLLAASIGGNVALAQLFVDAGATVNALPQSKTLYPNQFYKPVWTSRPDIQTLKEIPATFGSALIEASARGHTEICQLLSKHHADMNQVLELRPGCFGTPLIAACAFNHYHTCEMLLECGIDAVTIAWRTFKSSSADPIITNALITAASNGGLEVCRLLLSRGVDVNVIIPHDEVNSLGSQGTALIAAASNGHIGVCELLLDHGAFLDAILPDAPFPTALIAAASKGKWKACELLCDRGADLNLVVPNLPYGNALTAACRWRHLKTIKIIVQRGASVNMDPVAGDYGKQLLAACMGYDAKRRKVIELIFPHSSLASLEVNQVNEEALILTRKKLRAAIPFVSKINLKNKQTFSQVQEELQRKIASFTDDYFIELFKRDDLQILFDLIYDPLIITKKLRGLTKKAVSRIIGRLRDKAKLRELFEKFPLLAADVALAFVEDIRTARLVSLNPTPVKSRHGLQSIWE